MDSLAPNYEYIVLDNEAGMEHLSRGTTQDIDELVLVSNHSVKGVRTIARIKELVSELKLRVKRQVVIINMVPDKMDSPVKVETVRLGLVPSALIPEDEMITQFDLEMRPLLDLPADSRAVLTVNKFMEQFLPVRRRGKE